MVDASNHFHNYSKLISVTKQKPIIFLPTCVLTVPRVLFDGWSSSHFDVLFSSDKELDAMTTTIISTIKDYHMDGIVLEIWSQMPPKKSKYSATHFFLYDSH